jgi:hypothetical protein
MFYRPWWWWCDNKFDAARKLKGWTCRIHDQIALTTYLENACDPNQVLNIEMFCVVGDMKGGVNSAFLEVALLPTLKE